MSDYKIEKRRCPVTVVLLDGQQMHGDIFVGPVSRFRAEPQDPADFLNEDDPYFALEPAGAPAALIAKEAVARAETPLPQVDDELAFSDVGLTVEIRLVDGHVCRGTLFPDMRAERARLLDYLNSYTPRFLVLIDTHKVTLVNRRAVAHVREVG